jgi:glycosyltransferase involved in cell wall biosynthesis
MAEQRHSLSVLLIVHCLPPLEFSGTPAIAAAYARRLTARGLRVSVLYAAPAPAGATPLRIRTDEGGFTRYEIPPAPFLWLQWSLRDAAAATPGRAVLLDAVLDRCHPDLAHVLDLVNLPGEWAEALRARGVPLLRQVWNAEDLCGLIEPLAPPARAVVCPAPLTPGQCAECCFRQLVTLVLPAGTYPAHQLLERLAWVRAQRLGEFERLLSAKRQQAEQAFRRAYDRIVFPTASFRAFFERTLSLPPERTVVVEPGIDLREDRLPAPPESHGPVRFLFLGNLLAEKGIDDLAAVFSHPDLLRRSDYEVTLYGGGNAGALRGLLDCNPRVRYRGSYIPDRLPSILRGADVGLSPSRFETFHRVTREYQAAGLAVVGSTAFGIPEAVRDGGNGLLFEAGDVPGFRAAVLRLLDDRALLARLLDGARQTPVRTVDEEIGELLVQYEAVLAESRRRLVRSKEKGTS